MYGSLYLCPLLTEELIHSGRFWICTFDRAILRISTQIRRVCACVFTMKFRGVCKRFTKDRGVLKGSVLMSDLCRYALTHSWMLVGCVLLWTVRITTSTPGGAGQSSGRGAGSSSVSDTRRIWKLEQYPDPRTNPIGCGRRSNSPFLCDPDHLLTEGEGLCQLYLQNGCVNVLGKNMLLR